MSRKMSFVVVFVAFAMLVLSSIACTDTGNGMGSGAGCSTGMSVVNGQYVCNGSVPIDQTIIENGVKAGQAAYDAQVQKAEKAYGSAVQGSPAQKAAGALAGDGCGGKGSYKMGTATFCNP